MAYATRTQLAQGGIGTKFLNNVSSTDQDAALDAASRTADLYLRQRYATPLASWGDDLTRLVCHLAAWDLYSTRRAPGDVDDAIERRSDRALSVLKDIGAGRATLSLPVESESDSWSEAIGGAEAVSDEPRGW